ncbi:MAG: tRNA adenosine(34) deaminase TadA [Pirellulaceae bacterium]|nr:tRNA adenosine(34) deaminase TadA [Pirellulaceae bacterium]
MVAPQGEPVGLDADHPLFMHKAIRLAKQAEREGEVPVGAVIVREGKVIAAAYNQKEQLHDPTAHAEILAITQAASFLNNWRLVGCTLYVTLEPCSMCAGAIVQARIPQVVYGTPDPKTGAAHSLFSLMTDRRLNHQVKLVSGVLQTECSEILKRFFLQQRQLGKK